jgi:hypothetical protein
MDCYTRRAQGACGTDTVAELTRIKPPKGTRRLGSTPRPLPPYVVTRDESKALVRSGEEGITVPVQELHSIPDKSSLLTLEGRSESDRPSY